MDAGQKKRDAETLIAEFGYPELFCNAFAGHEDLGGCVKLIWGTVQRADTQKILIPRVALVLPTHVLMMAAQSLSALALMMADDFPTLPGCN